MVYLHSKWVLFSAKLWGCACASARATLIETRRVTSGGPSSLPILHRSERVAFFPAGKLYMHFWVLQSWRARRLAKSAGGSVPFPPSPWKGCSLARAPLRVRNKIRKSVLSSFGAERRRSCVCRSVARALTLWSNFCLSASDKTTLQSQFPLWRPGRQAHPQPKVGPFFVSNSTLHDFRAKQISLSTNKSMSDSIFARPLYYCYRFITIFTSI